MEEKAVIFTPEKYKAAWENKTQQEILLEIRRLQEIYDDTPQGLTALCTQLSNKQDILLSLLEYRTGYEPDDITFIQSEMERLDREIAERTEKLEKIKREFNRRRSQ